MATSRNAGPLREITRVRIIETDGRGNREVQLDVECGHTVFRKLRQKHRGPDPGSARCPKCIEDES